MSGVSHSPSALNVSPIVAAVCRMIEVQKPVRDVDLVDHQVGENAAAEIPEPAPIAKAVFVERLIGARAQKLLPIDRLGIDVVLVRGPSAACCDSR